MEWPPPRSVPTRGHAAAQAKAEEDARLAAEKAKAAEEAEAAEQARAPENPKALDDTKPADAKRVKAAQENPDDKQIGQIAALTPSEQDGQVAFVLIASRWPLTGPVNRRSRALPILNLDAISCPMDLNLDFLDDDEKTVMQALKRRYAALTAWMVSSNRPQEAVRLPEAARPNVPSRVIIPARTHQPTRS